MWSHKCLLTYFILWSASSCNVNQPSVVPAHAKQITQTFVGWNKYEYAKVRVLCFAWIGTVDDTFLKTLGTLMYAVIYT